MGLPEVELNVGARIEQILKIIFLDLISIFYPSVSSQTSCMMVPIYHTDNIMEVDQCFVLLEGSDPEEFFAFAENVLQERMRQEEEKVRLEKEALEAAANKVTTKVICVNKETSSEGKEGKKSGLFCWGTFVSDTGGVENRTFVN